MAHDPSEAPPPPVGVLEAWLEHSDELLALTDGAGRIVWANPAFRAATGAADGDALPAGLDGTSAPDAEQWLQPSGRRALCVGVRTCRVGANTLWALRDRSGEHTLAYELAHSLDATATMLSLTVDIGHIVQWRHDLKTGLMHYNLNGFKVLQIAPRPHGMPVEEIRALTHPDDLPQVLASAQRALQSGQPDDVDARYLRSDGTWRMMLTRRIAQRAADGTPIGFIGVSLDVTDRHRTEDALRRADERAALAARSAGIGTWEVDLDGDAQVVAERWDEQMFHLRGLAPGIDAPGREARLAMVHPDDRATTIDARFDAMASDTPLHYEFRVRLPDGSDRWLASRSILVRDAEARPLRRVGVNWDVTEAKSAETARQQKALAERESRAKSQFLARMSHELRTPLNAVLGFAELLHLDAARAQATGQIAKIGHIRAAGEQLLEMVNDVLELTGLETAPVRFDRQPLAVATWVARALPQVEALARRHGVGLRSGTLDAVVVGDAQRLHDVLLKLLANAIRRSQPGDQVWIEAATPPGTLVVLRVRDQGRGLTVQQLKQLFEPFHGLDADAAGAQSHQDTGIGLVIAKALVEGMGGQIAASSSPGRETLFELHLPAAVAPTSPPGAAAAQLLYIEDNPVNVLLVEELVSQHTGLRIESALTGEEGVVRARELQPALVLVDMHLPDFDGYEVLRRLRDDPSTRRLRCVALSANAMAEDIATALAAGFVAYWTKPIDFGSFLGALQAQVDLSMAAAAASEASRGGS